MLPALSLTVSPAAADLWARGQESLVFAEVGPFTVTCWASPAGEVDSTQVHTGGVIWPLAADGTFGRPFIVPSRAIPENRPDK